MMVGPLAVRWVLTLAFLLAGAYCGVRCVRSLRPGRRLDAAALVSDVAHLAMSVVMVAMVWSWTSATATRWEITLFTVAAGWYAARWVALSPGHPGGHPRLACAHHAFGMAAMVWMVATMPLPRSAGGVASMRAMPDMTATGMAGMSTRDGVTALILGGYFVVAAIGWLVAARRARGGLDGAVHVVVSAAMGAALLAFASAN